MALFIADVPLNVVYGRYNICAEPGVGLPAGTPFEIDDADAAAFADFGEGRIPGLRRAEDEILTAQEAAEADALAHPILAGLTATDSSEAGTPEAGAEAPAEATVGESDPAAGDAAQEVAATEADTTTAPIEGVPEAE